MPEIQLLASANSYSYDAVAAADPLRLDTFMSALPTMNETGDVARLQYWLDTAVDQAGRLDKTDIDSSRAALRDFDFLAASLLRHGVDPIASTEGLETELLSLGQASDTVPRGTVFTYAVANPRGERQRTFTDSQEESVFIEAVRGSVIELDRATEQLGQLNLLADDSDQTTEALRTTIEACEAMKASIFTVHRHISPEAFTHVLRPYFDPLVIGGVAYLGAGGAQMQLLAIDRMLWGITDADARYQDFYAENYPYLTPTQKASLAAFEKNNNATSLVDYVELQGSDVSRCLALDVMNSIRRFRYPHKKVADDNFRLRGSEALGSGSRRPDILSHMIKKTEDVIQRLAGHED